LRYGCYSAVVIEDAKHARGGFVTGLEVEPAALFGLQQQSCDGLRPEEGSSERAADLDGIKMFDSNRAEMTLLG
jgi:hypothetical protein